MMLLILSATTTLALQGDSGTDAFRCVEMREGQPWLWQADSYGAAATVHTLLYGRYMEVERVRENATGERVLGDCWVAGECWVAGRMLRGSAERCFAPGATQSTVAWCQLQL
jgi:hypothetical protein